MKGIEKLGNIIESDFFFRFSNQKETFNRSQKITINFDFLINVINSILYYYRIFRNYLTLNKIVIAISFQNYNYNKIVIDIPFHNNNYNLNWVKIEKYISFGNTMTWQRQPNNIIVLTIFIRIPSIVTLYLKGNDENLYDEKFEIRAGVK